jgi:hypothetical protein
MPATAYEFYRRVQDATEGTPYAVTETDVGFDVGLDLVDRQWAGLLSKSGLQQTYIHHVAMPEPTVYTITDECRTVRWVSGIPTLKRTQRSLGRVKMRRAQSVWGTDEHGNFGMQSDYQFDSEEGRELLVGIADQLGLKQRMGGAEKAGLYGGLAGVGVAVLALVIVGILALTGALG